MCVSHKHQSFIFRESSVYKHIYNTWLFSDHFMISVLKPLKNQNPLNILTVSCMDSCTVKRIVLVNGSSWGGWGVGGGGKVRLFTRVNVRKNREAFSHCHFVCPLRFRISDYRAWYFFTISWSNELTNGSFQNRHLKNSRFGIFMAVSFDFMKSLWNLLTGKLSLKKKISLP